MKATLKSILLFTFTLECGGKFQFGKIPFVSGVGTSLWTAGHDSQIAHRQAREFKRQPLYSAVRFSRAKKSRNWWGAGPTPEWLKHCNGQKIFSPQPGPPV